MRRIPELERFEIRLWKAFPSDIFKLARNRLRENPERTEYPYQIGLQYPASSAVGSIPTPTRETAGANKTTGSGR